MHAFDGGNKNCDFIESFLIVLYIELSQKL